MIHYFAIWNGVKSFYLSGCNKFGTINFYRSRAADKLLLANFRSGIFRPTLTPLCWKCNRIEKAQGKMIEWICLGLGTSISFLKVLGTQTSDGIRTILLKEICLHLLFSKVLCIQLVHQESKNKEPYVCHFWGRWYGF